MGQDFFHQQYLNPFLATNSLSHHQPAPPCCEEKMPQRHNPLWYLFSKFDTTWHFKSDEESWRMKNSKLGYLSFSDCKCTRSIYFCWMPNWRSIPMDWGFQLKWFKYLTSVFNYAMTSNIWVHTYSDVSWTSLIKETLVWLQPLASLLKPLGQNKQKSATSVQWSWRGEICCTYHLHWLKPNSLGMVYIQPGPA